MEPYGRLKGRIEGHEGERKSTGILTVSTNLEPSEFLDTKPPAKMSAWTGPRPLGTYVTEDCLICTQREGNPLNL